MSERMEYSGFEVISGENGVKEVFLKNANPIETVTDGIDDELSITQELGHVADKDRLWELLVDATLLKDEKRAELLRNAMDALDNQEPAVF